MAVFTPASSSAAVHNSVTEQVVNTVPVLMNDQYWFTLLLISRSKVEKFGCSALVIKPVIFPGTVTRPANIVTGV